MTCRRCTCAGRCRLTAVSTWKRRSLTTSSPSEDLTEQLKKLLVHDFTAKSQGEAFKEAKSNLKLGEVLVVVDFAENNKFLIQRETQGNHWNSHQCTQHPWVYYCTTGRTSMTRSIMAALSACRRI